MQTSRCSTRNLGVCLTWWFVFSERSSELRELQNSARPVTGTDARDNISTFLTRATNPDADVSQQQRTSLPDDVQNLIQRSIVTTALRRHGFRAALEQSLSSRLTPAAALRSNIISRNSSARLVTTELHLFYYNIF